MCAFVSSAAAALAGSGVEVRFATAPAASQGSGSRVETSTVAIEVVKVVAAIAVVVAVVVTVVGSVVGSVLGSVVGSVVGSFMVAVVAVAAVGLVTSGSKLLHSQIMFSEDAADSINTRTCS